MARDSGATTSKKRRVRAEERILGVPGLLMVPRLVLIACVVTLAIFGLAMVYAASSVTAVGEQGDSAYYFVRQAIFIAAGVVATVVLAVIDYHLFARLLLPLVWVATVALLVVVLVKGVGGDTMGATRWIRIGSVFMLQPSEFAKITLVLTGANLMDRYFIRHSIDGKMFWGLAIFCVGIPLVLIVAQPDKGTALVISAALVAMGFLAGLEPKWVGAIIGVGVLGLIFLIVKDSYSMDRVEAMQDPFKNLYDGGWQLAQGYYAFGSGGIFGVGFGMSAQKYSYLPQAYTDFIFAIIGEELGLVGTVSLVLLFVGIAWAGYRIARFAPDLIGRLIAVGCTSILWIQMLVNVCGVIGLIPSSGKPVPFVSYGGSSTLACFMLVGMVLSVSRRSKLPETVHDGYRSGFRVMSAGDDVTVRDGSTAGEATRRSERGSRSSGTLTLVNGGARSATTSASGNRRATRYERIDLGPTAAERLRNGGKRD